MAARTTEGQYRSCIPTRSCENPGAAGEAPRCEHLCALQQLPVPKLAQEGLQAAEHRWSGSDHNIQPLQVQLQKHLSGFTTSRQEKPVQEVTVPAPSCGGVHANACTSPATLLHKRIISGTHTKTLGSGKAQVISSSVGMAHNKSRETE